MSFDRLYYMRSEPEWVPADRAGYDLFLPGMTTEAAACISTVEETKFEFAAVCDSSWIYISNHWPMESEV